MFGVRFPGQLSVDLVPGIVIAQLRRSESILPRVCVAVPDPDGIRGADDGPPAVFADGNGLCKSFRRFVPALCTKGDGLDLIQIFFGDGFRLLCSGGRCSRSILALKSSGGRRGSGSGGSAGRARTGCGSTGLRGGRLCGGLCRSLRFTRSGGRTCGTGRGLGRIVFRSFCGGSGIRSGGLAGSSFGCTVAGVLLAGGSIRFGGGSSRLAGGSSFCTGGGIGFRCFRGRFRRSRIALRSLSCTCGACSGTLAGCSSGGGFPSVRFRCLGIRFGGLCVDLAGFGIGLRGLCSTGRSGGSRSRLPGIALAGFGIAGRCRSGRSRGCSGFLGAGCIGLAGFGGRLGGLGRRCAGRSFGCFCGGGAGELLHILAHLGDVLTDFAAVDGGADARDDFLEGLGHNFFTSVGFV